MSGTSIVTSHKRQSRRVRGLSASLGNLLTNKLLSKLMGYSGVDVVLVKRAVANGIERKYLEAVVRQSRYRDTFSQTLLDISGEFSQKALYWDDLGLTVRASDNYLQSTFWGIYAGLMACDLSSRAQIHAQYTRAYEQAAPHLVYPAEPVDIPYLSGFLKGYIRLPSPRRQNNQDQAVAPSPCVVLLKGFNSPKEELYITENVLLALGMATLSFDYPGEQFAQVLGAFNVEELGNAICAYLSTRREIDPARIALKGLSLGGRLALYLAIRLPDRFKALVTVSAPHDLLVDLDCLLSTAQHEYVLSKDVTKTSVFDWDNASPIGDNLKMLGTPLLVAGGGRDLIALPEETRLIYNQAQSNDKKLILCSHAGHGCYEMMPSLRYEIAQWLKQRL